MDSQELRTMIYTALFAALITAGAYIIVPVGPVPITLQTFFILLAGIILGPNWGLACILIYLLAGACGLPVFSKAASGLGHLIGPTGGYLIGFIPAVYVIGYLSHLKKRHIMIDVLAMILGTLLIYAFGLVWLKNVTGMPWSKAFYFGMLPFLLGDAVKICSAVAVAKIIAPIVNLNYINISKAPDESYSS